MKFIIKDITIFDLFCIRKKLHDEWYYLDQYDSWGSKEELGFNTIGFKFYRELTWMDSSYVQSMQRRLGEEGVEYEVLGYEQFFTWLLDNRMIDYMSYVFNGRRDLDEAGIDQYMITNKLPRIT